MWILKRETPLNVIAYDDVTNKPLWNVLYWVPSLTDDNTFLWELNAPNINWAPTITATQLTSKGWLLKCIDSATGDIARTTSGWIEDEKYWLNFILWVASASTKFDSEVKRTWKFTLKISSNENWRWRVLFWVDATQSVSTSQLEKYWIPCKANTKYILKCYVKTQWATDRNIKISSYNTSKIRQTETTSNSLNWTNEWTLLTTTTTTWANSAYLAITFIQSSTWSISDAWFDINSMTLEEVVETTNNTLTSKSPAIQSLTANGTYDNIDQSQILSTGWYWLWTPIAVYEYQQFIPTKNKLTSIVFKKDSTIWTYTWNVRLRILWDTTDNPNSTIYSEYTITNAIINSYSDNTDITVNLPCNLTAWNKYWIEWYSTTTDVSNNIRIKANSTSVYSWLSKYSADWITLSNNSWDLYFKTLYYKPCTNLKASLNWDIIDLSADSDWFLDWSVIDLENWKYSFVTKTTDWNDKRNSAFYSYITPSPLLVNTYNLIWTNWQIYTFWATTKWSFIYKLNSWIAKFKNISVSLDLQNIWNTNTITIAYSLDNSTYIDIWSISDDNISWTVTTDLINWNSIIYLKFYVASWNGDCRINTISINWDLDTSTINTLYNYPTNKAILNTYIKTLTEATTTVTYRATKYWFPALEFAEWVYQYLKVDTSDSSSIVQLSEDWTTYVTKADWESLTISSTTLPIIYTDITIPYNRLLLSSNDYNADLEKDWSLQQKVVYKEEKQWISYDIADIQADINNIKTKLSTL